MRRSDDSGWCETKACLSCAIPARAGVTVLLTQRTDHLRAMGPGCLSGGRIDAEDEDAIAAAGVRRRRNRLARAFVEPLGYLDSYLTVTAYLWFPWWRW